ncbi:type 2 isopentenyl-diphosphate Delta-isomerase [Amphritea balenae]|uniref:Isopentenyl-diphosphate delta-isomerase n=1 Tax=Amphritea balenae TaxID=452629 RepID=A0A3P1SM27_9GAMM|nr:type 2 isopentenyl-diphosphate Delta-isomerase [Amphritea balenae]RRC98198.1 type 2 isopentenyl-diphosphate Delta-isomerase [Amphritea balenae]GGK80037.1 isopentenyl-diphosphate delta-isomerase [Amphritea balenae]
MSDQTNDRKIEHIQAIEKDPDTDRDGRYFDTIHLTHRALPGLALEKIDTRIEFLGKSLSFPLLISSMTGGDHALIKKINRNLAEAAERTGVALAVGSQRVMFTQPSARESFDLRQYAPTTVLLGNIGAVQLNCGFSVEECQQAVDLLGADGLYLHLNPLQEAIQPEGDTDFSSLTDKIATVVNELSVPVMLKEVGSGLSPQDIESGLSAGVKWFDLAGCGGTSWSRIEHHRAVNKGDSLGIRFQDWGIPTPLALKLAEPYQNSAGFIASGGLRDGIDMVKSVILGASLCGMAAPFLKPAMESADAVVLEIERLRREFTTAMFLLGMPDVNKLFMNRALILGER